MRTDDNPAPLIPPGRLAFTATDLECMGFGKRGYIDGEVKCGRLIATKRGRCVIYLRPHVEAWVASLPKKQPRRAATEKPPPKRTRRRRALRGTSAEASA